MNLHEVYYWVESKHNKELCWIEKYLIDYQKGIDYYVEYRESNVDNWHVCRSEDRPIGRDAIRVKITKEEANKLCKEWYRQWNKK